MPASFSPAERADLARYCGYPPFGTGGAAALAARLALLGEAEVAVARSFLASLRGLEAAIPEAAEGLDTAAAAGWTRNAGELAERTRLFDDWRRRLCGFLGLPPGPAFTGGAGAAPGSIALVV
jgi:hypothetical protein